MKFGLRFLLIAMSLGLSAGIKSSSDPTPSGGPALPEKQPAVKFTQAPLQPPKDDPVFDAYLKESVRYAQDLFQQFPPEKYFVLNYGPATAIASAYFRALQDKGQAKNYYSELMLANFVADSMYRSEPMFRETIFKALDETLPSPEVLAGRKIVVHRKIWSGATLKRFLKILQDYQQNRRPDIQLASYMVTDEDMKAPMQNLLKTYADDRVVVRADNRHTLSTIRELDFDIHRGRRLYLFADHYPWSAPIGVERNHQGLPIQPLNPHPVSINLELFPVVGQSEKIKIKTPEALLKEHLNLEAATPKVQPSSFVRRCGVLAKKIKAFLLAPN